MRARRPSSSRSERRKLAECRQGDRTAGAGAGSVAERQRFLWRWQSVGLWCLCHCNGARRLGRPFRDAEVRAVGSEPAAPVAAGHAGVGSRGRSGALRAGGGGAGFDVEVPGERARHGVCAVPPSDDAGAAGALLRDRNVRLAPDRAGNAPGSVRSAPDGGQPPGPRHDLPLPSGELRGGWGGVPAGSASGA